MADITNKNKLQRRIELFLDDELNYSINEDFCKETMKMMREFIGHASHRLDCEESRVKNLKKKLKEYRDLEKQGLLLRLPCKVGTTVYLIKSDGKIVPTTADMMFLGTLWEDYGKEWFLTREEAEQKLKEMECD